MRKGGFEPPRPCEAQAPEAEQRRGSLRPTSVRRGRLSFRLAVHGCSWPRFPDEFAQSCSGETGRARRTKGLIGVLGAYTFVRRGVDRRLPHANWTRTLVDQKGRGWRRSSFRTYELAYRSTPLSVTGLEPASGLEPLTCLRNIGKRRSEPIRPRLYVLILITPDQFRTLHSASVAHARTRKSGPMCL